MYRAEYKIAIELPGVEKEDIDLSVTEEDICL